MAQLGILQKLTINNSYSTSHTSMTSHRSQQISINCFIEQESITLGYCYLEPMIPRGLTERANPWISYSKIHPLPPFLHPSFLPSVSLSL